MSTFLAHYGKFIKCIKSSSTEAHIQALENMLHTFSDRFPDLHWNDEYKNSIDWELTLKYREIRAKSLKQINII